MWIIEKSEQVAFLKALEKGYIIYDLTKELLPPKSYFFPPEEITFNYSIKEGALKTPPAPKKFVLYGLSLRDLEAMTSLDKIMSEPERDFYYFQKRSRSIIIGLTEEKFDVPPGGDIILSKLAKDSYRVVGVTEKGDKLLRKLLGETRNGPAGVATKVKTRRNKTMKELKKLLLDPELLKDAVKWSLKGHASLWKRLAKECLGCGICTYLCPLCHCFSIEDRVALSGDTATRLRRWDACTLPGFAKIAGGHDFHPTQKERYYNWFYHKFVRAYMDFGSAQCVGCGRCQTECPARIDIEEILLEIVEKYKEKR